MKSPDHISRNQASDEQAGDVNSLLQKKEFGVELRKAREASSLSIIEVADKLLVSVDIIKAIENSQADSLPALTFTKGYIRNYARLLGIPADKIISAYLCVAPDQKQILSSQSVLPIQASSGNLFIKIISLALAFFAVVILLYWLYQTDFTIHEVDQEKPITAQQNTALNKSEAIKSGPAIQPYQKPVPASRRIDESTGDTLDEAVVPEPEVKQPVVESDVTAKNLNNSSSNKAIVSLPALNDVMVLMAIESSWVEVKDTTGQRLFYQLLNAGEEIELQGKSPFQVFLGNAKQVRIEVNQKIVAFDHLINSNRNVVNIKIEADAQVSANSRR